MPNILLDGDPIYLRYGVENDVPWTGVFLAVFDRRLSHDSSATDDVNMVTTKIFIEDGGGCYIDMYTGKNGFGVKVKDDTMATYMRRFGVPERTIAKLPLLLTPPPNVSNFNSCACCHKQCNLKCSKCGIIKYCSKECQKEDWAIHKLFCHTMSDGSQSPVKGSVRAILLPENDKKPKAVYVPCSSREGYTVLSLHQFMMGAESVRSDFYPHQSATEYGYHVFYKDDFLIDRVSRVNKCAHNICKHYQPYLIDDRTTYWRGNIVIVKGTKKMDPEYLDMSEMDLPFALEFLVKYTISAVRNW